MIKFYYDKYIAYLEPTEYFNKDGIELLKQYDGDKYDLCLTTGFDNETFEPLLFLTIKNGAKKLLINFINKKYLNIKDDKIYIKLLENSFYVEYKNKKVLISDIMKNIELGKKFKKMQEEK